MSCLSREVIAVAGVLLVAAGCGSADDETRPGTTATATSTSTNVSVSVGGLAARTPLDASVELSADLPEGTDAATALQWSATCGALSAAEGAVVTWTAPSASANCEVTVTATIAGAPTTGAASTRATHATEIIGEDAAGDGSEAGFDVLSAYYGVVDGTLFYEAGFGELDPGKAQLEVFLLREAAGQDIYSFGLKSGKVMFWQASRPPDHPHYHWQKLAAPGSLKVGAEGARITAEVALADVGLDGQASARIGIAGAPHAVAETAKYTDRLPDALLVTATDVEGLTLISLP